MAKTYYTYRIRVANRNWVQVEKWDNKREHLGQPHGVFRYQEKIDEITPLLEIARKNNLNDSSKVRALGEVLFDILFDEGLRYDFITFYERVVQDKEQLLRVELDIDERRMPDVAALPWEFLCLPKHANLGTLWIGTVPHLVFSRWRSHPRKPKPIKLEQNEKLKIALVVSTPKDLPTVAYEPVIESLKKLVEDRKNRIELLPIVNAANPEEIEKTLSNKPHILHFIGHGRLRNNGDRYVGEIALVDPEFDEAMWVDADYFSEPFNQHRPGVVMLQACEGGMLSASQAFVGIASSIVEQNIPVVVAMQYEVTNSTASRFSRRFYQQLAADAPVDIATQHGRRSIALGPTQYRKRDFATPVIFMRVTDGYLFKREDASSCKNNLEHATQLTFTHQKPKLSIPSTPVSKRKDSRQRQEDHQLIIPSISQTQTFEFTTVKINYEGKEISRERKQASFLIEDLGNDVILEMVVIPGGTFLMGSPESEGKRYSEERPQHSVTIQPFLMSKYPITQAKWREVSCWSEVHKNLKRRPSRTGGKNYPVTQISWYDAVEFCDRLSQKIGYEYRLPSEAEWEYACRAGTSTPFHFGDTITTNLANYDGNYSYASESQGIYINKTTPVGDFKVANNFGLFDMHGNVWEWCLDRWYKSYSSTPTHEEKWLESRTNESVTRVIRGGSWHNDPQLCRSASRLYKNSEKSSNHIGFRVTCSLPLI